MNEDKTEGNFQNENDANVKIISYKYLFKFLFCYIFVLFYMFNLTCNKQKCQYDSPKIINLIKKKKKAKQRTRIKFILLKVMIFSFLSFLNEIKFNSDSEIKRFDGNSKELFDSNFIFISKNINKQDITDIMRKN